MIEIRSLTRKFGHFTAVNDLTLDIPKGQILGMLGPNGAGKTTTIRMLTGYLPPTAGAVQIDGFNSLTESRKVRQILGYLPEANPLYMEMRVEEYLTFRAQLFGLARQNRRKSVDRVIERCWLTEMRKRLIGRLSKGYRQRVGLAAALLHSPTVLILDEPTSGLDPTQIRETRNLIRELAGEHTMVLSSHILPEIEATCDRIIIIAHGQIRADGTIAQLQQQSGDSGRYIVEVPSNNSKELLAALNAMSGVGQIQDTDMQGWTRFRINASIDQTGNTYHSDTRAPNNNTVDLREAIGKVIHEANVPCRELSREGDSLEQLFIRIMSAASQTEVDL